MTETQTTTPVSEGVPGDASPLDPVSIPPRNSKLRRSAAWQKWGPTLVQIVTLIFLAGVAYGGYKKDQATQVEDRIQTHALLQAHETRISSVEVCQEGMKATEESILRELSNVNTTLSDINAFLREMAVQRGGL